MDKEKFTERLKRRFPLRLHMTLILVATGLSGLLTTRCLLAAGVETIVVRYPLAVLFSYLIFFILIKLWLKYLNLAPTAQPGAKKDINSDVLSNIDFPAGGDFSVPFPGAGSGFSGGGGQFSGAGASGSFDEVGPVISEGSAGAVSDTGGGVLGDAAEGAASALGDEGGLAAVVAMAVIGAVVAVVLGAGVYMVCEAPLILSEAAFEVILAASLVKSSRAMNEPDWIGSVLRNTWKPFGISLLVAMTGAVVIHALYPQVTRISELVKVILQ